MDEHLKKRLIGAIVLVALAVIFVPMLLDEKEADTGLTRTNVPPRPEAPFTSRIQPLAAEVAPAPVPLQEPPPVKVAKPPVETKPQPTPKVEPPKAVVSQPAKATVPKAKPATTSVPPSSWVIQVGSFSSQENADKLVKQLRAAKFPAFLKKIVVDGKVMFRVRVGPEVDQKKAQQMQARIEEKFKLKGKLERYP